MEQRLSDFNIDLKFMRRALLLASYGEGRVAPNPLVGAVIVDRDNRIIGEGFHARYGGPHAEVNAINSVKPEDIIKLPDSTVYVTLEPCAHYGKTPPCANLIVETGIRRVVIASPDPNPLVAGKGVHILRNAGIEVIEGVMQSEADELNRRFMARFHNGRPWIQLKWAMSADEFMAIYDEEGKLSPVTFSSPLSKVWMHRERSGSQTIMVGSTTERIDSPRLDNRLWGGNSPRKISCGKSLDPHDLVSRLKEEGVGSLMIEGGPTLLQSFISAGLYDEIRIERAPFVLGSGLKAPQLPPDLYLHSLDICRRNTIATYFRIFPGRNNS